MWRLGSRQRSGACCPESGLGFQNSDFSAPARFYRRLLPNHPYKGLDDTPNQDYSTEQTDRSERIPGERDESGERAGVRMSKGNDTRKRILEQTAQVFNRQGYFGASMADILRVTGLQKGGLYNHFRSKDELALEAFDHAYGLVTRRFADALRGKTNAVEILLTMVELFRGYMKDPPLPGGCPIMNTAVESVDAHPALRQRAIEAMDKWRGLITRTVTRGIEAQEIKPGVDAEYLATIIIATVEGALMMARLYSDDVHMERATDWLVRYIESEVRAA